MQSQLSRYTFIRDKSSHPLQTAKIKDEDKEARAFPLDTEDVLGPQPRPHLSALPAALPTDPSLTPGCPVTRLTNAMCRRDTGRIQAESSPAAVWPVPFPKTSTWLTSESKMEQS